MIALSAIKTAIAPYMVWIKIIAAAVLIGLAWWAVRSYNERLREQGRAEIRAEDADALDKAKAAAKIDHDKLTKDIQDAAHANDKELADLRKYRDDNPLHGSLCRNQGNRPTRSNPGGQIASATGSTPPAPDVQPLPSGNPEPVGQSDPDIRGMLSDLTGRADQINTALRSCLAVTR